MYKIVLVLLFMLSVCPLKAQTEIKDSLDLLFANSKNDSLLLSQFKKSVQYYRNRNSELHFYVIKKALDNKNIKNNEEATANFKRELGIFYRKKGDLDSAIIQYNHSIKIHSKLQDSLNINIVKSSLANVYKARGDYQKSIQYFNEVISYFDYKGEEFTMRKLITQFNLSSVYMNMQEWKTADLLLEKIYHDSEAKKNKQLIRAVCINLCATKQKINELDQALTYGKIAEKLENNPRSLADLNTNIGSIFLKKKEYAKAHQYFLKGLNYYKDLMSDSGVSLAYNNLGNNSIAWKKYNQAEGFLLKAKKILQKGKNLKSYYHNQKMLANLYEKKGDLKKSLEYLKKNMVLNDSILGIEKQKAIANFEVKFQTEKVKRDKDILENKSKILALENQKNKGFLTASLLIIALLLISGFFYLSRIKVKREAALTALELKETKKRLALEKQYQNSELRALKAQMNPHFIFNAMNSIQSLILKGNKHEAYTYLTKFASLIRENLNISEKSFVDFDEELSLLKKYLELEKLRFKEDFEYEIELKGTIENIKIPSMIIQPFVENAIKHGLTHKTTGIKKLKVAFFITDVFICTITDNGIGFEASKEINKQNGKSSSFSTKSIKEKLKFLEEYYKMNIGFSYEDVSQGSKVIIKIPYQN